ncbi:MAG: hypothetical protein JSS14_24250 [Proteobacteria bacterium]|nr:hypothetical protein [Pseudomonadota bacterium]
MQRSTLAAALLAASCLMAACADQPRQARTVPSCPESASELPASWLYGYWVARIDGQEPATVVLQRHLAYDGVSGSILRTGKQPAQLAGDIDAEGQLALDESQDGKSISASWSGTLKPGSCAKEFVGSWYRSSDDSHHPFVLRKSDEWK